MQRRPPDDTLGLVAALLREGGTLVGRTLALARVELEGNLRALLGLVGILGLVVVLLVAAFFVFLDALVKALAVVIGSEVAAAVVVASPFLVCAGILGALGLRRIAGATSAPTRTVRQLEKAGTPLATRA